MKARVLFTCWPFVGHVMPQMSIASCLRDRGDEVAFFTGEGARSTIESEGFTLFPFNRVDEERAYHNMRIIETSGQRGRARGRQLVHVLRDWVVETIPDQVADLQPIIQNWKPDILVTDLSLWGPIVILWESAPIPVALSSTFMGPLIPGPDAPAWGLGLPPPRTKAARLLAQLLTRATDLPARGLRRRIDEIRATHGLAPLDCSVNAYTGRLPLYLVHNLPELDYNRRDLPSSVHYVGPCAWHPSTDGETARWLEALPSDRPWIHVTESTLRYGEPFLLRAAVDGLAGRPLEVILTTGHQRSVDELDFGRLPDNVHVTQWISHPDLLPRCAALVTTGGTGTVMAALRAGVPLVVVPTTWDKPDNARRIVEAGVGVRLAPRRCTAEALRAAVSQVLEEPRFRVAARRLADRLAEAPGPSRAAELLESLSANRSQASS